MRPRVVVVQTTIPDYRRAFFEGVSEALGPRFELLSGDEDWEVDVSHSHDFPHTPVRNIFLAGRRLLWQAGVLRPILQADVAVLSLNPRILTSWIVLLARRATGRRTLLWGHAWPRRGEASTTDRIRALMRSLASTLIVYTETEAQAVKRMLPGADVIAAPNALYRRAEVQPSPPTGSETDLVCVGRLTRTKKPALLIDAFAAAQPELPDDIRLVYVGDGQLRDEIEKRIRTRELAERVVLTGHVSSPERLRDVYARAIASVSAGYVGLSLTQTLSFGVAMIIVRKANHGPEIEAAVEGVNAVYVEDDSPTAIARAMVAVVRDRDVWLSRREEIAKPIRERYSIERMVDSFVGALRVAEPPPHPNAVARDRIE
jgi:glycosyltransferase involved in cell wall biosynthesis